MHSDRPEIHRLPQEIVRLIAAGEVIERPMSVVKELIENSLDADARHIEIKLENGGLVSLAVRDDGHGIPAEQVPLLLERHTTSKIEYEADLEAIYTLGFRGEALYSIAAASDVILSTRFRHEDAGTRLTWENGGKKIETIPWPGGTQVESLRLFHSTPARRKFLRSVAAEYGRVASLISSYALAYPEIAWKLVHNGRETLRTPGTGNLEDALISVYGADTARKMIPVDYQSGGVGIIGAISSIELTRARRTDQIIFLNGRLIKDPAITAAFERPYMQFLAQGRRPLAILKITCDPTQVDVNVHPHKREVRLANPRAITGSVYNAVNRTLTSTQPLESHPQQPIEYDREIVIDEKTGEVRQATLRADLKPSDIAEDSDWAIREPKRRHTSDWPPADKAVEYSQPTAGLIKPQQESGTQHQYPAFDEMEIDVDLPPEGHTVQFANTYIIYNQGQSVYLIDQHNLHERILFEEFRRYEDGKKALGQSLLFPMQVTLPPSLAGIVVEHLEDLSSLGFELEEFSDGGGEQAFVLRAVPIALKGDDPVRTFTDIVEAASEDENLSETGGFRKSVIINLACKTAIKAGQVLTDEEMAFLIGHIKDETFTTCPHGRPTMVRLDEDWFKRVFKRS